MTVYGNLEVLPSHNTKQISPLLPVIVVVYPLSSCCVRAFEICGWLWCAVAMNSNHKKSGYPLEESCHRPLHLQRYTQLLPLFQHQHSIPLPNGEDDNHHHTLLTTSPSLSFPSPLTEDDLSYLSYRIQYLMEVRPIPFTPPR